MKMAIVTGAGGFIGSHFVRYLKRKKYYVIGIDIKNPEFSPSSADTFILADLRSQKVALQAIQPAQELYMFAANMGGVGFINQVHARIMHDNTLITFCSLEAARKSKIKKVFFPSSACIYPQSLQTESLGIKLKESDALPAEPDSMYGWEKLYGEQICKAYQMDYGIGIRIARLHNIYGPEGTFEGGREKSPAAVCRKIALANNNDAIEIWGDGKQIRSYCYVDDCCEGIHELMESAYSEPINIGSEESVSIDRLVDIVSAIAHKKIKKKYLLTMPQGVRGRNSNNALSRKILGWEPKTSLKVGLTSTYSWINSQVRKE